MRHIVLVGHARFAEGMASAAWLITGKKVPFFNAYLEGKEDFKPELSEYLAKLPKEDEVVLLTDLFGGSVNNDILAAYRSKDRIHIVTGTNLALILGLLFADEGTDTETVIRQCIAEAREGMCYGNDLSLDDTELDEF